MTPLIVHPTIGYNTFIDVASADIAADDYLHHDKWEGLTLQDKQRWLLFSGALIINLQGFIAPDTVSECLPKAQMDIIFHNLLYQLQEDPSNKQGQIRARKFDVLYREYFKIDGADNVVEDDIPSTAWECLLSYGAIKPLYSGGVGVFRRTR